MGQHKKLSAFNRVKFYTKKSRMMTDWRKNLYHSYKLTIKNWKLSIHKSILKCDLSKVVHTSRCPYPESSTACVDTNTLKLGLSRVVHSLPPFMICLALYTVYDHLIIYLGTVPTLWFKRKKHLVNDMTWPIKIYIYP